MYVPVVSSAAIVEKLELIWVCCRWRVDLFMFSCGCWHKHGVYGFYISSICRKGYTLSEPRRPLIYFLH